MVGALATAVWGSGCLLASPPDYQEDPRLPPVVDLSKTSPTPYQFHEYSVGDVVTFSTSVRVRDPSSDDDETRLFVGLYSNFTNSGGEEKGLEQAYTQAVSSTFEPEVINLTYAFNNAELDGCYQFTMFLTYADNGSPPKTVDREDEVTLVTWWINVDSDGIPNDVSDCLTEGNQ